MSRGRRLRPDSVLRQAVDVLPWVAVRVHDLTGDDLGMALVPMPIELGDEITVEAHPWPFEVCNLVWTPAGSKIAAIVEVRPAVLHPV